MDVGAAKSQMVRRKRPSNWFYSQEQPLLVGGLETMGGVEKQELQTDVRFRKTHEEGIEETRRSSLTQYYLFKLHRSKK